MFYLFIWATTEVVPPGPSQIISQPYTNTQTPVYGSVCVSAPVLESLPHNLQVYQSRWIVSGAKKTPPKIWRHAAPLPTPEPVELPELPKFLPSCFDFNPPPRVGSPLPPPLFSSLVMSGDIRFFCISLGQEEPRSLHQISEINSAILGLRVPSASLHHSVSFLLPSTCSPLCKQQHTSLTLVAFSSPSCFHKTFLALVLCLLFNGALK